MAVAQLTLEIRIEHAQSLKDRAAGGAVAEGPTAAGVQHFCGEMDEAVTWQSATMGVTAISRIAGLSAWAGGRGGAGGAADGE